MPSKFLCQLIGSVRSTERLKLGFYLTFRPASDRRDDSMERPPFVHDPAKMIATSGSGSGPDSTLTAASLIDAIITHQINQSSNPNESPSIGTLSDSLFQSVRYRRNPSPVDNRGALKERTHSEDGSGGVGPLTSSHPGHSSHSNVSHPSGPPPKTAFTLGEHIESIITKDFHQGSLPANSEPPDGVADWRDNPSRPWRPADYPKTRLPAQEVGAN